MACGTGKTLVSQRIAEELVPDGGLVIFASPSIGLTAQSRREWLREKKRPIRTFVVCSDSEAGRGATATGHVSEISAPVSTDPQQIAEFINRESIRANLREDGYVVIFTTYHSLDKLLEAQSLSGIPAVPTADLIVADEAHRTTGALQDSYGNPKTFQLVHDEIKARKRLYQTATPRIYRRKMVRQITDGVEQVLDDDLIVDMNDFATYGPPFHNLSFVDALNAVESERRLCDYRVVIMKVRHDVPLKAKRDLKNTSFFERVAALGLTLRNATGVGFDDSDNVVDLDIPNIHSCIAFSNRRKNAKEAEEVLNNGEVKDWIQMQTSQSKEPLSLVAGYLDGTSNAAVRKVELDRLASATLQDEHRVTNNVQVLSEGINVPALDAICFLEPRTSEIDIVQAVGRVMRRPKGSTKRYGYIIVPIEMNTETLFEDTIADWPTDWGILGQVLRALRAHDPRIETDLERHLVLSGGSNANPFDVDTEEFLKALRAGKFNEIALRLSEECGIQPSVEEDCNLIKGAVSQVAAQFVQERGLAARWQDATGITLARDDKSGIRSCVAATLFLANAMMLHECLVNRNRFHFLQSIEYLWQIDRPEAFLSQSWKRVLAVDYRPVFEPALEVIEASYHTRDSVFAGFRTGLQTLAKHCSELAPKYAAMGMDHVGKLYQSIMDHPAGDGAYYTLAPSAVLLAELACDAFASSDDPIWIDYDYWKSNAILDPACGSGTLLAAMLTAISRRARDIQACSPEVEKQLIKNLIEHSLTGLDINKRAIQLAASQLAIFSAGIELTHMGLWVMPRRVRSRDDTSTRVGSLDLLEYDRDGTHILDSDIFEMKPKKIDSEIETQMLSLTVDPAIDVSEGGTKLRERLAATRLSISNPPFTRPTKQANQDREEERLQYRSRLKDIRSTVAAQSAELAAMCRGQSIRPFFTSLLSNLTNEGRGVIALVMPSTAATSSDAIGERQYLASEFHLKYVISIHHPTEVGWSAKSTISEILIVLNRRSEKGSEKTEFVSLHAPVQSFKAAIEMRNWLVGDHTQKVKGSRVEWPSERVSAGDWSPVAFCDGILPRVAANLEEFAQAATSDWVKFGDCYRAEQISVSKSENGRWYFARDDVYPMTVFRSASNKIRRKLKGKPDDYIKRGLAYRTDPNELTRMQSKRSMFFIIRSLDTQSCRVTTTFAEEQSVGTEWLPVFGISELEAKGLSVYLNSTVGRIMMRARGGKKLKWPKYAPGQVHSFVVPGKDMLLKLASTFDETCNLDVPQFREGRCSVRDRWDIAVADTCGFDQKLVIDWADRLAREPITSGKPYVAY